MSATRVPDSDFFERQRRRVPRAAPEALAEYAAVRTQFRPIAVAPRFHPSLASHQFLYIENRRDAGSVDDQERAL